jgi:hypothetical protein
MSDTFEFIDAEYADNLSQNTPAALLRPALACRHEPRIRALVPQVVPTMRYRP